MFDNVVVLFKIPSHLKGASHFDTVQFRHSAILTKKRNFDIETLQKINSFRHSFWRFDTLSEKCIFVFISIPWDFVLVDLTIQ